MNRCSFHQSKALHKVVLWKSKHTELIKFERGASALSKNSIYLIQWKLMHVCREESFYIHGFMWLHIFSTKKKGWKRDHFYLPILPCFVEPLLQLDHHDRLTISIIILVIRRDNLLLIVTVMCTSGSSSIPYSLLYQLIIRNKGLSPRSLR